MYSLEQRRLAVETYIRFDLSAADTIAELGYPNRGSLRAWYREYAEHGEVRPPKRQREPKFTLEMRRAAVDYYLGHGRSLARTMRKMGYPASRELLGNWIDELAPGQRKRSGPSPKAGPAPLEEKMRAVAELESRDGTASEVAERHGVSRTAPYAWRRRLLLGDNAADGDAPDARRPVNEEYEKLPTDEAELTRMALELRAEVRRLQIELDVRSAALDIVKKDPGADPNRLTNREKTELVGSLRPKWPLGDLLEAVGLKKSSCYYRVGAIAAGDGDAELREQVRAAFDANDGTYGRRRIHDELATGGVGAGERRIARIMREERLVARGRKRKRGYSSYAGEISEHPGNKVNRDFRAALPNFLWLTDVTQFRIPAGKVYLSPVLDCFDGAVVSWTASTSPDAEMANSMLRNALATVDERQCRYLVLHSDCGCHYRWPEWISICEEAGITRSMSAKGCSSPDNSAMEGFFGRMKNTDNGNRAIDEGYRRKCARADAMAH